MKEIILKILFVALVIGCFAAAAYETTWNIKAKRALVQMSHCPCVQEVQNDNTYKRAD